ncbi:MAG: NAD(P)H-hydrate dehydratase [Candidatus Korobacteraceae bacterium]
MKILTAAEMCECDRVTSERQGVPSLTLMENAGTAVAEFLLARYPTARRITVLCGKGNNGGDGFVVARKLHQVGRVVEVVLLADASEVRGDAAAMLQRLPVPLTRVQSEEQMRKESRISLEGGDLIVDAILGTGFRPPVKGLYAAAITAINAATAPVVAVDIPSGADADAFQPDSQSLRCRADAVVTFTAPRPAHLFADLTSGPTLVAPIGSPEAAIVSTLKLEATTAADVAVLLRPRALNANKGSFGHVLVMGGSLGKCGAAAMAGMAALRAGAGLSTVATPRSVLPTVAGYAPELMTEPLAETEAGTIALEARDYGRLDEIASGKTVLAIGPGISRHADTVQFLRAIIDRCAVPTVLDADGLNAFEGCAEKLSGKARPLVLTPHPGEMARLAGMSITDVLARPVELAREFAHNHQAIVVLKLHRTLIAFPDGRVWVNTTGNPGMATGGTGDVLTGMIAGMVAQHPKEMDRAVGAAVYLHGLAGDIARDVLGEQPLIATDLLRFLPDAFRATRERAGQKLSVLNP